MPQISHIHYHDIRKAQRFDADFFKPEYLQVEEKINHYGYNEFVNLIDILTDGKHWGVTFTSGWVLFLRNTNIVNWVVNISEKLYISEEESNESKRAEITSWDILLTTIWTIGECAVVPNEIKRANINQNLVKIRLKKWYSPILISIFLNSKFWKHQTNRMASGNVQPLLNYPKIKQLKIPLFLQHFQIQIESIVKNAYNKQDQAKLFYQDAEQLLLEELGLLEHLITHHLTFTTTKAAVNNATRYDAEYFQPKYEEIIERIEEYRGGWDYVKNIVTWKKGIEVGTEAYSEKWKDFVRVSDFTINGIENVSRKISNKYYQELKSKYQPKKWEILFTKDGTIGISSVLDNDHEWILSGAFLRLSLQEKYSNFEKHCLSLIFSSVLCKLQVEKLSWWALIAHLKPSDFENFKIPLISPEIQTRVADLITQSHQLRRESKQLLDDAKRMMEEEIEKT